MACSERVQPCPLYIHKTGVVKMLLSSRFVLHHVAAT
jgi:hypothetical protein